MGRDDASLSGRLRKEWNIERQVVVASLMQHGIELGEEEMIHHWQLDRERRVVVASLMQHEIELGVGKMIHHCGLRKEWVSKRVNVASVMQQNAERDSLYGSSTGEREMLHRCHSGR